MIEARIKDGSIDFGTTVNKEKAREFFKRKNGKTIRIECVDRPSLNKRRFFEGAVVPFWFYQHPLSGWVDREEARENLKLGYNNKYIHTRTGELIAVPSSLSMTKDRFDVFMEKVQDGFMQNGLLYPDSEDYKKWLDGGPLVGEEYPPLEDLKETYEKESGRRAPKM